MINYFVQLQIDSTADELMEAAVPALIKYNFVDANYNVDEDKSSSENLSYLIDKLQHTANDQVFIFDSKCIDENESYSSLALEVFQLAGVRNNIKKMKSSFSYEKEKAGLIVLIGDEPEKKIWKQADDWVAEEFLSFMDELLEKHFNKRLLSLPTSDQCARLLAVDAEDYAALNALTKFHQKGYSPRELYGARVASTWAVAIAGFVASVFIGWYFLGFLWSLLTSLAAWVVIGFGLVLKYAWICMKEEDVEKLRQEDPEAYSKAMVAALVQEAAKRTKDPETAKKLKQLAELDPS